MKKGSLILFLSIVIGIAGCGICKPNIPPAENNTTVHVVDSIAWHDSIIYHIVPKEVYNDYTSLLDTLRLSTSYSEFESYVDTTHKTLKGTARNTVDKVPVQIKWKEKIVYKDSIKYVKEPYPVEVVKEVTKYPTTYWWFMGISILALLYIILKLYLKFKP